jgi:glycerol-3-phosphate dehydrogenase
MALTLADAIVRRTPIGALGYPGDDALQRAVAIVGRELGWSADRRQEEIASVQKFYRGGAEGGSSGPPPQGIVNALKT